MATLTSQLVVSMLDRVSGPARAAAASLRGLGRTIREQGRVPFGVRLDAAMERNRASMAAARGDLLDAAAAFYVLKNAIAAPVRVAMEFESAMADVKKVVDEFGNDVKGGPEAFQAFKDEIVAMSKEIPLTVSELGEIAAGAGEAGIATKDLGKFVRTAAIAATAFGMSSGEVKDVMFKLGNVFRMNVDQMSAFNDTVNHISNSMAATAPEVLNFVNRAAGAADMLGLSADNLAGFGGALIASGIKAETAARGVNALATRIQTDALGVNDALKSVGLSTKEMQEMLAEDGDAALVELFSRLSELSIEDQAVAMKALAGMDFSDDFMKLIKNPDTLRQGFALSEDIKKVGSAFKEFETRSATFANAVQLFKNQVAAFGIVIGAALIPRINELMERLIPVIEAVGSWAKAHPELISNIFMATAALVGFKLALAGLRFAGLFGMGGILSLVSKGYLGLSWAALAASGGIRAVAESIRYQNTLAAMAGTRAGFLHKLATGARALLFAIPGVTAFSGALGLLSGALAAVGVFIAGITAPVWATVAALVAAGFAVWKFWDRIKAVGKGVGLGIIRGLGIDKLVAKLREMRDAFKETRLGQWIEETFGGIEMIDLVPFVGPISNLIEKLGGLKSAVENVKGWFSNVFSQEGLSEADAGRITEAAARITEKVIDAILAPLRNLGNLVKEAITAAFEGIGIDLGDFIKIPPILEWLFGKETKTGVVEIDGEGVVHTTEYFDELAAKIAAAKSELADLNASLADDPARTGRGGTKDRRVREVEALKAEIAALEAEVETAKAYEARSPVDLAQLAAAAPAKIAAAATIERLTQSGQALPTAEHFARIRAEAEATQARIDALNASLEEKPARTGRGGTEDSRVINLEAAQAKLSALAAEEARARAAAEGLTEALMVIGETNVRPEIRQDSLDSALSKVRQIQSALSSINSSSAGAPVGGPPPTGARRRGGPISAGASYIAGEKGPELITAARSGYVHKASDTAKAGAGPVTVSAPISITVNGAGGDPSQIAAMIRKEFDSAVQEAFRGAFGDTGTRFV